MYQPNYKITDKILNFVTKVEILKSTVNIGQLDYSVRSRVSLQARANSLFHLAHILGLGLSLKDAEKLAEGRNLDAEDDKMRIMQNFRNLLEFNRSNAAESYTELDFTALLHLNRIILTGWKETWEVKFRSSEDIDLQYEDWATFTDKTISQNDVEPQLVDLLTWYQSANGKVNNLLRIMVLAARLVQIMPFLAGNKYTIMGIVDLLMYQYGYTTALPLPITRPFDLNIVDFWKIWDEAVTSGDLTLWIEKYADILSKDATELKTDVDRMVHAETEKNTNQPFLDLNKRQLKVLRYLQTIPTVRREDYCQMMDVSTMTAFRDLNDLVRKKLIKVEGQGRGTRYMLVTR